MCGVCLKQRRCLGEIDHRERCFGIGMRTTRLRPIACKKRGWVLRDQLLKPHEFAAVHVEPMQYIVQLACCAVIIRQTNHGHYRLARSNPRLRILSISAP
ncbi:unnamed protein product (plasmid) [Mycetohabitans rhizoxinica HKI 454]|uniref:Uncharacterized protein n=1 Tax=Mycetohabitans rhizoxinica (strain DSM 19002 / CIP 109453 / HKI 454) TaxID=882378 RepID=E5AUU1_MYCRK|nr:unnamed protein product [Mycetohabitans rhizoxinica HKI 454]